jgi:hypothetical protein
MKVSKILLILVASILASCAHIAAPLKGGACPREFPVKGNIDSYLYHTPGSVYYSKTRAEICFDLKDAAYRHGFRPAKL